MPFFGTIDNLPSVNSQVCSGDIATGITEQVDHGTLQVGGRSHFADGDEGGPFLVELRVVVEDFTCPILVHFVSLLSESFDRATWAAKEWKKNLQSGQHVTGADTVDSDVGVCPFHGQTGSEVPDGGLCGVVGCLGLGHVDDGAGHATDHDDAAVGDVALHQVASDARGEEVRAVDIDAPEFLDALVGVHLGGVVLGEASRGHEVVDLSVLVEDVGETVVHAGRVRHVAVVCGDLGQDVRVVRGLAAEHFEELDGLLLTLLLYKMGTVSFYRKSLFTHIGKW